MKQVGYWDGARKMTNAAGQGLTQGETPFLFSPCIQGEKSAVREDVWKAATRGLRSLLAFGCCLLATATSCTVRQQQQVLGVIGQTIPGHSNSVFAPDSSSASSADSPTASSPAEPEPRVDPDRVEAQLVLHTLQQAMTDNPAPFQACLDNAQCKPALTAHLIRLQKQALGTLELPPTYDRYDLKRGKE